MKISWSPPDLGVEEKEAAKRVIDSGWLTQGKETAELERELQEKIGVQHIIVVNNGTAALITALLAHGIGPEDEVIVPSFTFIASINSILAVGAKPILVDCDPKTFNITPQAAAKAITSRTKAILPVDVAGMPVDITAFEELAKERNLIIIEDAAEALGAQYQNKVIGSFNHTVIFSFHMAKLISTGGEGGCIATNDLAIAEKCRMIRNHGMSGRYDYREFGLNFRITDVQSAIGRIQLRKLNQYLEKRNKLAQIYHRELKGLVQFQEIPDYVTLHPYMIFNILVAEEQRDILAAKLNEQGIDTRICWPATNRQAYHKQLFHDYLPVSESLSKRIISLPMGNALSEEEVYQVVKVLKKELGGTDYGKN